MITTPKKIVGLQIRTSNEQAQSQHDIYRLWMRFDQEKIASQIPHPLSNTLYVVYFDYEKDFTKPYSYLLGMEVDLKAEAPAGLSSRLIPADNYTPFEVKGPLPEALLETWNTIWNSPLNRKYATDFEVYDPASLAQQPPRAAIYLSMHS